MIIYKVTIVISREVCDDWLRWMQEVHIPEVMKTGLFQRYHLCRITGNDTSGTFHILYFCRTMRLYERYRREFAPALQKKHAVRYEGKFTAKREILKVDV